MRLKFIMTLLFILAFSSLAYAEQQDDSFGISSTEFITTYNAVVATLLGEKAATSPLIIKEAKYSVTPECDFMHIKISSCDIIFQIYKNGNLGFIHISGSKNDKNIVDEISSLVGLFMLGVTKGQGFEDLKSFVEKIKTVTLDKNERNELTYRGMKYKNTTAGAAIQWVIMR